VLATLHSRHIVHRDIKPENILLEKEDCCTDGSQHVQVKITDFGLARILRHEEDDECAGESQDGVLLQASATTPESVRRKRSRAYSRVGSDYYTAPEVSMGLGYDTPVDMYSLGITLYVMLCGVPPTSPFIHDFFRPRADSLSDGESSSSSDSESVPTSVPSSKSDMFPSGLDISPQAQDLICKMIHPDPSFRITASDALKHDWITQHTTHEDTKATLLEETTESSMPSTERPRSLSVVETEALLCIPIQGSIHEIAPPVDPPSNSPTSRGADCLEAILASTPPTPSSDSKVSISLTLADVCSKLVPLADRQNHHKRHRNHRRHAHLNGDTVRVTSKKHHRNASDISMSVIGPVSKKKVRIESRASSPPHFLHQPPNSTCANNRIVARRFNSPIPQGVQFVGPLLPQKNLAVKGAN
jgi:serine/threonine protein kinase